MNQLEIEVYRQQKQTKPPKILPTLWNSFFEPEIFKLYELKLIVEIRFLLTSSARLFIPENSLEKFAKTKFLRNNFVCKTNLKEIPFSSNVAYDAECLMTELHVAVKCKLIVNHVIFWILVNCYTSLNYWRNFQWSPWSKGED